jgi:hypothetical protein
MLLLDVLFINIAIRLPPFPQCKVYSREAEFQHQREMQVLSVHYLSPRDIPISPMEPEDYYEPPSIPTMIPLDKPGSQPIGLSNTVVPQISVLQSLTANPSYLSALLQQQPINNWNQVPVQNYNPPIPAVFQKSYGQPPIPSRGRAGIPKAFRNRK